ncbi:hypothetical protein [Nocardioides sp. KR10-350]|uniref:hypothetical protein n=1 Tax=Nocardioides cheoyonin TaxID=3156615 RepID=UPI0032B36DA2
MTAWEYLTVWRCIGVNTTLPDEHPDRHKRNSQWCLWWQVAARDDQRGDWEAHTTTEHWVVVTGELGLDGWELVAAVPVQTTLATGINGTDFRGSEAATTQYLFKRPITRDCKHQRVRTLVDDVYDRCAQS